MLSATAPVLGTRLELSGRQHGLLCCPRQRWRQHDVGWRHGGLMRDDRKHAINLCWRGRGAFRHDGRTWDIDAPCAYLRRPHRRHDLRLEAGLHEESWLVMPGDTADLLIAGGQLDPQRPVRPIADGAGLRRLLGELARALGAIQGGPSATTSWGLVLARLQALCAAIWCEAPTADERDELARIRLAVDEAPARAWRLADLAGLCGCGPDALRQRFRRRHGCGPCDVVLEQRMALARAWLLVEPVAVVARRLGYTDHRGFGRQFRRLHGLSPTAYRQLAP